MYSHKGFILPLVLILTALIVSTGMYLYVDHTSTIYEGDSWIAAADISTYNSAKLGFSFRYLASQGDPIVEEGNRVYVGGKEGQWVEKFSKDPNESLAAAIEKKFLAGISESECVVDIADGGNNVLSGSIEITRPTNGEDPPWTLPNICPPAYSATNGIRYFWMDITHPDSFYFFSIGQYAILAEPAISDSEGKETWQDTFEVTK